MSGQIADHPPQIADHPPQRLAIIGGGSSGLVCLKMALDFLDGWEVVCFEKSDSITGCWGNPYPGFVSTSTIYTTQFACFPICEATFNPGGGASREEFFCDGEYGEYLESFADSFGLRPYIRLKSNVEKLQRSESGGWDLVFGDSTEHFDAVVVCTGLAARPKPIDSQVPTLSVSDLNGSDGLGHIKGKTIVVIGGGESAVDYANRLAKTKLNNDVYLSLHSGVRVSPRYHPIRGVPSDFLRNRLMLSVHRDIRNWLGQVFVEARIKHQERFERWFPGRAKSNQSLPAEPQDSTVPEVGSERDEQLRNHRQKDWAFRLTKAAKDDLFNMFHNKSDDFLDAVGDERIKIVGEAIDASQQNYCSFDSAAASETNPLVAVSPDLIVPAIGYESTLDRLTEDAIKLEDFYLGCCHAQHSDLFLVGFARPIIGNIPTISEIQARYVCGLIGKRFARPADIAKHTATELAANRERYEKLNLSETYPVEMIPYCDRIARLMKLSLGPSLFESVSAWWRTKLAPASTMHYFHDDPLIRQHFESAPVYMPITLIAFCLFMKPVDWGYRLLRWLLAFFN